MRDHRLTASRRRQYCETRRRLRLAVKRNAVQKAARRGSPDPAALSTVGLRAWRKPLRLETFGQTDMLGQETRAQPRFLVCPRILSFVIRHSLVISP